MCSHGSRRKWERFVINANQNLDRYAAFGYPVVPDEVGGFAGPLAGLHAGMTRSATAYVATAPCDLPFLPADLVTRLAAGMMRERAQLAVVHTFAQPHPVFALVERSVLPHLRRVPLRAGRTQDRRLVHDVARGRRALR